MTGLERNSDIVFAASYAPLLQVLLRALAKIFTITDGMKIACQQHTVGKHRPICSHTILHPDLFILDA